ncbi:hypothetical protein GCM10007100_21270 [Roseibacillus persicicus]|uniref:Uncharacterized protein n=1 Tax=Roseibacillus persicicus TaxID=454148 RepID=A0A918WKF4_9BACT|nr:hypothetical protein GCM10007100_21270 [Roseibacillus persicicus]
MVKKEVPEGEDVLPILLVAAVSRNDSGICYSSRNPHSKKDPETALREECGFSIWEGKRFPLSDHSLTVITPCMTCQWPGKVQM